MLRINKLACLTYKNFTVVYSLPFCGACQSVTPMIRLELIFIGVKRTSLSRHCVNQVPKKVFNINTNVRVNHSLFNHNMQMGPVS
jgi:hypothetical protein